MNFPQDLGHPVNPVNDDEEQGDHTSIRRHARITPNPGSESSQVRRQENAQSSDSWKNGVIRRNLVTLLPNGDLCGQQLQEQNFKT